VGKHGAAFFERIELAWGEFPALSNRNQAGQFDADCADCVEERDVGGGIENEGFERLSFADECARGLELADDEADGGGGFGGGEAAAVDWREGAHAGRITD
jgi:hypothetical protein